MLSLKSALEEESNKRNEDKKQAEVYQSHSKFMKAKVSLKISDHFVDIDILYVCN